MCFAKCSRLLFFPPRPLKIIYLVLCECFKAFYPKKGSSEKEWSVPRFCLNVFLGCAAKSASSVSSRALAW